jgi:hypothetical protein
MKSKSSIPCTALGCRPLWEKLVSTILAVFQMELECLGSWIELVPEIQFSVGKSVYLLDEASCLAVEESVLGRRAHGPAGSLETANVVIGRVRLEVVAAAAVGAI